MKRRALILVLSIILCGSRYLIAQTPVYQNVIFAATAPSGTCTNGSPAEIVITSGVLYTCQSGTWASVSGSGSFIAGGDLSGTASSQTVVGIDGHTLPTLATGYLNWTGAAWAYSVPAGGSPGGTSGAIQYNNSGAFGGVNGTGVVYGNGASAPTVIGTTGSGNFVRTTAPTITSLILNGSPSGTGVSSTGGPGTLAQRDGNNNLTANNFLASISFVPSAAGVTTLTVGSSRYQVLTGTTTQTFQLPSATTLANGNVYTFNNNSTGALTLNDGSGSNLTTIPPGGAIHVVLTSNTTTAGSWDLVTYAPGSVQWGTAGLPNSALTNSSTTVNGTVCTLGSTCTVTTAASSVAVGTTTITGGTSGQALFNNSGVLGSAPFAPPVGNCTAETANFTLATNACYYANSASAITATLPTVATGAIMRLQNTSTGTATLSFGSNFYCTAAGSTSSGTTCSIAAGDTASITTDGTSWYVFVAPSSATSAGPVNTTLTVGTTAVSANSCGTVSTLTMTGLTTSMTLTITPTSDISAVTGWSPGSGGQLYFTAWPSAANTVSYYVCNPTSASITPGSSTTWNVSAK